jgi:glycosyltransferase 2 family protein
MGGDEAVKQAPSEAGHASLLGVEDGSGESASDTGLPYAKLRVPAALRQVGRGARPVFFWLRLVVGVSILVLIVGRVDLGAASVRPGPRLLAAIVCATVLWIISQAVAALRWKLVLDSDTLPWSYLLRLYIIGSFFGLFLPTSVGGDAVRALAAVRSSQRAGGAMASVLIDRGFGVMAIIAYAGFGLILAPDSIAALTGDAVHWHFPAVAGIGLGILIVTLGIVILSRSRRMRALWRDGIAVLGDLVRSPGRLGRVWALALVCQGLVVLVWYTLAHGMRFAVPISTFLWAVPIVSLSALMPVTFAGLGVREGVWLILLAGTAIPRADIVTFSLLYFACNLLVGIIGGVLFVSQGLSVEPIGRTLGRAS